MIWIIGFSATISKIKTLKNTGFWYLLLTQQFFDISALSIWWTITPKPINHTFLKIQLDLPGAVEHFVQAETNFLQKKISRKLISHFWHFNDHNSGKEHDNLTNDHFFNSLFELYPLICFMHWISSVAFEDFQNSINSILSNF